MIPSIGTGTGFLCKPIVIILAIGMAVRIVIGTLMSGAYDIQSWALIISNFEAGGGLFDMWGYYYAPPWGYLLGVYSELAEFLGLGSYGGRITDVLPVEQYDWYFSANLPSVTFALSLKIMLFLFDIAVGYLIYWIVMERTGDLRKAVAGFGIWFLCPFVILLSASAGMFDAASAMLTLLCIVFLMRDRCFLAGMMFGAAALMKLFPAFLVFIFVGYLLSKHREDGEGRRQILMAALGTALMATIILLPQIIQGDLAECFSFITNRATGAEDSGYGDVTGKIVVIAYCLILVFSVIAGYLTWRSKNPDRDGMLLSMCLLMTLVMFLYPSVPQYMLLMFPFAILHLLLSDGRYRAPIIVLIVGVTLFTIAGNATLFLSFSEYSGLIPIESVMNVIEWFQEPIVGGLSAMSIAYYIGGVLQYAGTVFLLYAYIRHIRGMDGGITEVIES